MFASRYNIAAYGPVFGFIAFAIVLFQFFHGPIDGGSNSSRINAKAVVLSILKGRTLGNEKSAPSKINIDNNLLYTSIIFAFLALVAAAISYIKHDKKEAAYVIFSIGAVSLLFQFLLVAVGLIVISMIVVIFQKN